MEKLLQRLREERGEVYKKYDELRSKYGEKPLREWETSDRAAFTELHERLTDIDLEINMVEIRDRAERAMGNATIDHRGNGAANGGQENRDESWIFRQAITARDTNQYTERQALIRRDMQVDLPAYGGYISIPQQVANELIATARREFVMRGLARNLGRVARAGIGVPTLAGRPSANMGTELTAPTMSDVTFGKRAMAPNDYVAGAKISRPLLNESNAGNIVESEIGYASGYLQESKFFSGTGINEPLGVLTASSDGIPTSQDKTSGTSGSFKMDDLIGLMLETVRPAYFNDPSAALICSPGAYSTIRKFKDDNGQYIATPVGTIGNSATVGAVSEVMGKPIYLSEFMPTVSSNNYPVIFGAWRNYGILDGLEDTLQVLLELYAAENKNGYIRRGSFDGAPMLSEAFARLKVA